MLRALALLAVVAAAGPAAAQEIAAPVAPPAAATGDARQAELDAIARDIELTEERKAALQAEIDSLDKDRASLNAALVDGAGEVQKLEAAIAGAEKRLEALFADEDALRASLSARRATLAEVLAALQRMGHRPPPVMLVRPEDALSSIRSAILLGAVVPDLRAAADELAADLARLVTVRQAMEHERDELRENASALAEGRERIALLMEERQRRRAASVEALAAEQARASTLAEQATSLKELIARLEAENAAAAAAAAEAERAAERALAEPATAPANLGESGRLAPAVAFARAKGLLPLPASGTVTRNYGDPDGLGGRTPGISLTTRAGAQISSPNDGWVVYAGTFRSYGQLLIINAGDGYHVLLAGMERIDVQLGQFVLAGEPVAVMASQQLASRGAAVLGASDPVLYIEFRKDGASIDPAPWWAASNVEKVGG